MADLGYSGLYTRLKDKDLPLEHKLQLLRFAWKSCQVFIPNKEQVLIDLLTGYLLNKKKYQLNEAEVGKVWKCLHDVLRTRKAHQANKQGQGLVIKQSICQVILEALSSAVSTDVGCLYLQSLIGCCSAIMSSTTLSYIFTDRLNQMLSLLGTLCSLLVKHIDNVELIKASTELLDETVKNYLKVQKTAPNQKQILQWSCNKLLPEFLTLWSVAETSDGLSSSKEKLSHVIEQTLFHKDHQEGYAFYLNVKYGEIDSASAKKPKLIEQVFTALELSINNKTINTDAVYMYIPALFESFIRTNCHNSNLSVAHHMLRECCDLIGVKPDSAALSEEVDKIVVTRGINQLLKVVQRWDIFVVTTDDKGKQLQFYRHLINVLLENISYSPDWYSCFTVLLQLYHQILEPSLTEILLKSWLNINNKELQNSVASPLDNLLQELVTTYQKLRQFQKFMVKLLDTLKTCQNSGYIITPTGFLTRFGEVVQSLPQGMTVDIWKMFVQHLKINHVAEENTGHFQGVCAIFCEYLLNVKVTDYSTTDITSKAIQEVMVAMEREVLVSLLQKCIKDKQCTTTTLVSTLQLCHIWGEMMIMLAQYTQYRADSFVAQPQVCTSSDLSYVHSYLSPKHWLKIHKRICKSDDKKLIYSWDMLILQQIRAELLFSDTKSISMAAMFDFPAEVSTEDLSATWYPSIYCIDKNNFLVAKWHLLVSSMASVYCIMNEDQCQNVARFAIQTVSGENKHSEISSLSKTTDNLLSSSWIKEFSTLQSCIVTATWDGARHCFSSKIKSGKKRKSDTATSTLQTILSLLSDRDVSWQDGLSSDTADSLQKIAKHVNKLLGDQDDMKISGLDKIENYLQILQKMPIEYFSSCDQLRCLLGLLSITVFLFNCCQTEKSRTSPESKPEASDQIEVVLSRCIQLMMVILETSGTASVFQLLDVNICLDWLRRLQSVLFSKRNSLLFLRAELFIEMSCSSMVKDYQLLDKLPTVVTKLCLSLKDSASLSSESDLLIISCLMQEASKLLNRPYLKDSLKSIYTEMFVSMATAVLDCVDIISTQRDNPASCHVVKCLGIVIATSLATEVKGQFTTVLVASLDIILEWCLESLQKTNEDHRQLTALNCLFVIAKHHDKLDDLTPLKKLNIWNKLISFLQVLLDKQLQVLHDTEDKNQLTENLSHDKEIKQSDARVQNQQSHGKEPKLLDIRRSGHSRKEIDSTCQRLVKNVSVTGGENLVSVQDVIKYLDQKEGKSLDSENVSQSLISKDIDRLQPNLLSESVSCATAEIILSPAAISSMYRTLVFEGNWESNSSEVILVQVQSVIAAIVMSFDLEEFTKVIQGIVANVSCETLLSDVKKLQCSLYIWQRLLKLDLSQEQAQVIVYAAQNLMLNFQSILQQLSHHGNQAFQLAVAIPTVRAQEQMLALGKSFLSPQMAVLCLHSCQFLQLDGSTYFPAFHAACDVLDTLLMQHTEATLKTIPSFLSCAKKLLLSVVQHSNQDKVQGDKDIIDNLVDCAHQMERLFTQISTHKVDFGKVALYVVSNYVTAIQQVTLVPAVKRALVPAVYKMLDLCDKHAIAQLHTVLSHGVCEVFKLLYSDYNKYYRYTGKI